MFFTLGAGVALYDGDLFVLDDQAGWIVGAYILLLIIDFSMLGTSISPYLHCLGIGLGVGAMLCASKSLIEYHRLKSTLLDIGVTSFFIFAAHEPLLQALKKLVLAFFVPESSWTMLVVYFTLPAMVICVLLVVFRSLDAVAPRILSIAIGRVSSRRHLEVAR